MLERGFWTLSYSLLLAPVFLLSVLGIMTFDSPSTSGTLWLFSGDGVAAISIDAVGLVIFGLGCEELVRHFRFARKREWILWHFASCALLYLVASVAVIVLARSGDERGRAEGVLFILGAAAVWGIFLNALITAYTVTSRRVEPTA